MTAVAIVAVLLALHFYLRGRRLAARLRRVRVRLLHTRAQLAEAERRERATLVRSFKRRAALVRLARYCRALDVTLSSAMSAGVELGRQVGDRDAAIDALTARIAELMPRAGGAP